MFVSTALYALVLPVAITGGLYGLALSRDATKPLFVFAAPLSLCGAFLGMQGLPQWPTTAISNLFVVSLALVVLGMLLDNLLDAKSIGLLYRTILLLALTGFVYYPRWLVSNSVAEELTMAVGILLVTLFCWGRPDWWEQRVRREYPLVAAIFVLGYVSVIGLYASFRLAQLGVAFAIGLLVIFILDSYGPGSIRTHFLPMSILPMALGFLLQAVFYTTLGWPTLGTLAAGLVSLYLIGTSPFNEQFLFRTGLAILVTILTAGAAMGIEELELFQGNDSEQGGSYRPYEG